jgi:hypothetical protein
MLSLRTSLIALCIAMAGAFPAIGKGETTPGSGYKGIWYTLGFSFEYGDKYSGGLGTYPANQRPMAVYASEVDTTFFTYGGTPRADLRQLQIMVGAYDHKNKTVTRPKVVHMDRHVDDPHDNAALQIDSKGYLWIFKSGRGDRRPGYIYRSDAPYSIAGFTQQGKQAFAYPQPWWIENRGFLLLFTKYTAGRELYWKTSPDGVTWSEDQKLAGFGGHYQVSGEHKGKIATFFNYHPGGDVDKRTNLYYAQSTDHGQTWTTADGKILTLPLASVKNEALVRDLVAMKRTMYTCDLNFDKNGNPALLYVRSALGKPGPAGDPREWVITHWTGKEWVDRIITKSTHNYDMGSLYIDGPTWRIIAPTLEGPDKWGTGGEMALWISQDDGTTWKMEHQITKGSTSNHSYARRPQNAANPFFAYWADGDTKKLGRSHLYFTDSTGQEVWQLPYEMSTETASPIREQE